MHAVTGMLLSHEPLKGVCRCESRITVTKHDVPLTTFAKADVSHATVDAKHLAFKRRLLRPRD